MDIFISTAALLLIVSVITLMVYLVTGTNDIVSEIELNIPVSEIAVKTSETGTYFSFFCNH